MNTYRMSITPKAIQDLLDELEASQQSRLRAWNVLQRLRSALSEAGNVTIPPPAQKDVRCVGRSLGTRFDEILRIRNDATVLIGTPLSRCDHQGRMQRRLSAGPSGVVESVGSGGGSDSALSPWRTIQTNDFRRRTGSPVSYPDTSATGSADQLEHCSDTGDSYDPVQP
jgi:hypothetical protein